VAQNTGAPIVAAALIVGASIVAGALLVRSSVEGASLQLADLKGAVESMEAAAPAAPARAAAARPGRPDPARRYAVNTKDSPVKGNPEAQIAIVEFSDFQCPFCGRVTPTLKQIEREYGDKVRIVFKHLPLPMHPKAPAAHAAAEAAHRQGKFWEMHDLIFADQRAMSEEKYGEYAAQLGLDLEKFKADAASSEVKKRIDDDASEARRLGVTGTPGFFVNGRFLSGAQPFDAFKSLIDEELGKV
jgi:protein-disulfide isomerase